MIFIPKKIQDRLVLLIHRYLKATIPAILLTDYFQFQNSICTEMGFLVFLFMIMSLNSHMPTINSQYHIGSSPNIPTINCLSWRLGVETYNIRDWKLVPLECEGYIGRYMLGRQYRNDCDAVVDSAINYAMTLNITGDGKDIWVFDIDETALSNLPYYARRDVAFGAVPYNASKFSDWVHEGVAPPVPAVLRLYHMVASLGVKAVFLSGSPESFRQVRVSNLRRAGYHTWEKLVLRESFEEASSSSRYKSSRRSQLVRSGYRIHGNIGDQWSDLLGMYPGNRTFKLPDPLYYIG